MTCHTTDLSDRVVLYGSPDADTILVQMADDHDLSVMEQEAVYIRELSGGQDFCLKAVKVSSWNQDLTPWQAPPVFGNEGFGAGAPQTLEYLLDEILPEEGEDSGKRIFLGGYSLAGLFALWAGYQTDRFEGIAAASPSIWFPNFTQYMREHRFLADAVYLSLGDREEKTRNRMMAEVGNAIREGHELFTAAGKDCVLEWNQGNHFREPDLRTAKAFAWLMNRRAAGGN